jgi:hypothetical protein
MENQPISPKDCRQAKTTLDHLKNKLNYTLEYRAYMAKTFENQQLEYFESGSAMSESIDDLERSICILEKEHVINDGEDRINGKITELVSKDAFDQIEHLISRLEVANKLAIELKTNMPQ